MSLDIFNYVMVGALLTYKGELQMKRKFDTSQDPMAAKVLWMVFRSLFWLPLEIYFVWNLLGSDPRND